MPESADSGARHLRAVPDPSLVDGLQAESPRIADPGSVQRPQVPGSIGRAVGFDASALRHEIELLRAVRQPGVIPPVPVVSRGPAAGRISVPGGRATHSPAPAVAPGSAVEEAIEASSVTVDGGSLGERFEALSIPSPTDRPADAADRIDAAISRLRSPARGGAGPMMLPSAALRRLALEGDPAAWQWITALVASSHRVLPPLAFDLRVDGVVSAVSVSSSATIIERRKRPRPRSGRDFLLGGRPDRLALAAAGGRSARGRSRTGVAVLSMLLASAHTVEGMVADGVGVEPLPFWRLIAAAVPAAEGPAVTVVHSSGSGDEVTVAIVPGRPISVVPGRSSGADAQIRIGPGAALRWLVATGTQSTIDGELEAEELARAAAAGGFSPIRQRA